MNLLNDDGELRYSLLRMNAIENAWQLTTLKLSTVLNLDAYTLPRIDDQINEIANCKIYSTLDIKSAYYQIPLAKSDREFTAKMSGL